MLSERIMNFYISNIVRSFYKVVGSVAFLGNPVGLVKNFGNDLMSVLFEPAQGILDGEDAGSSAVSLGRGAVSLVANTTVGVFDSGGKIVQSLARALRSIDPDASGAATRAATAAGFGRGPRNIGQGLFESGKAIVWGLYKGSTGVFVAPYMGAKENGGMGFVKGVGAGLVGLFLKPAAGALDSVLLLLKTTSTTISTGSALITGLEQTMLRVRQRIPRSLGGGPGAGGRHLLTSYSRREAEGEARLYHLHSHGKALGESYRYHAPIFDLTLYDEAVPGEHESAYSRLNAKWETIEAGTADGGQLKQMSGTSQSASGGQATQEVQQGANAQAPSLLAGLDMALDDSVSDDGVEMSPVDSPNKRSVQLGISQQVMQRGFIVSPAFGGLRFPIRQQGGDDEDAHRSSDGAAAGSAAHTVSDAPLDIMIGPASPSVAEGGTEQLVRHRSELVLMRQHLTSVDELLDAEEAHTRAMQAQAANANKQGDGTHASMHAALAPYVLLVTDKRLRVLHTASNRVHWACPLFIKSGRKPCQLHQMNVIQSSTHAASFVAMENSGSTVGALGGERRPQLSGQLDKHVLSISVEDSRRGWALLVGNVQRAAIAFKALSDALENTPDRISLRRLEIVAYRMNKKKAGSSAETPAMVSRSSLLLQRRLLTFRRRALLLHIDSVLVHSWSASTAPSSTHYANLDHLRDLLLVRGPPLSGTVRSGTVRGTSGDEGLTSIYASAGSIQGGVSAYRIRVRHIPIMLHDKNMPGDKAGMSSRVGARLPKSPLNPGIASDEPSSVAPMYTVHRTYQQWARLFAFIPRAWHLPAPGVGRSQHASVVLPYLPVPDPAFGSSDVKPEAYGTDSMMNTLQRALSQLLPACQREAVLQAHCHPTALPRPDWLLLRKELERFLGVV
jgi:hypothetical protein